MRHGKKLKKIGRDASHRKATLQQMSAALIEHKQIKTTFGKAKALRIFVEPILTKAKDDSTASRRQAFRQLGDKEAVKRLYDEIAGAIGDRPGGYTRIVKLGQRAGDAAEMAIVELVDFGAEAPEGSGGSKKKTRRSRRRSGGSETTASSAPKAAAPAKAEPAPEPAEEEAPEAAVEEAPADEAEVSQPAEAVASDAADPETTGNVQVPPSADEHPDAEQGAATQTGEPGPGADATNQGRSHDNR